MAPLHADHSSLKASTMPQTISSTANTIRSPSADNEMPLSPDLESPGSISPLTQQLTLESEGDIESETDLPTMTPPSQKQLPLRFRHVSPSHLSIGSSPSASANMFSVPPMQRAHSSPGVDSTGQISTPTHSYPRRPPSPLNSGRRRSPLRSTFEELYPASSWGNLNIEPNIPEHAELEIAAPVTPENEFGHLPSMPTYTSISNTFPRSRRRPASPLHQSASAPSLHASARAASMHSTSGTPPSFSALSAAKYANEPYPTYGYSLSSTSSMPSTPTSLRSRSPSISSLDTIEDTPDAEEAARMEDEFSKQRGSDDGDSVYESRRKSLDLRAASLRSNKDRKRWSVCGAERRADFSLEPIEE